MNARVPPPSAPDPRHSTPRPGDRLHPWSVTVLLLSLAGAGLVIFLWIQTFDAGDAALLLVVAVVGLMAPMLCLAAIAFVFLVLAAQRERRDIIIESIGSMLCPVPLLVVSAANPYILDVWF